LVKYAQGLCFDVRKVAVNAKDRVHEEKDALLLPIFPLNDLRIGLS
jgi:hypothetical protein